MTPVTRTPAGAAGRHRPWPTCSIVVSTYNRPDALALVLAALRAQDHLPDEVLVADDGSDARTATLVASIASTFPVPLHHVWHADEGFRAGAIRNRAIAAATGAYVLQLDGDIVLHRAAVRHHLAFARPDTFVQGSRALLDRALTEQLLRTQRIGAHPFERGVGHRLNGWYLPWLAPFGTGAPRDPLVRVRGCHVAYWRADALRVNGYNEAMTGWGLEDSEFVARLQHAGVTRRTLKFAAVAWHLWHEERPRDAVPANRAIYDRTIAERATRCALGIHTPTTVTSPPPAALPAR
jgi:glycosyltransferase involved in cell wall biosynthesis